MAKVALAARHTPEATWANVKRKIGKIKGWFIFFITKPLIFYFVDFPGVNSLFSGRFCHGPDQSDRRLVTADAAACRRQGIRSARVLDASFTSPGLVFSKPGLVFSKPGLVNRKSGTWG